MLIQKANSLHLRRFCSLPTGATGIWVRRTDGWFQGLMRNQPPVGRHEHNPSWQVWMRDLGSTHPACAVWRKQLSQLGHAAQRLAKAEPCWARSHLAPSRRVCI